MTLITGPWTGQQLDADSAVIDLARRPGPRAMSRRPLVDRLRAALDRATGERRDATGQLIEPSVTERHLDKLRGAPAVDERDALQALLEIYDLWTAPVPGMDGREHWQAHPAIAEVKWRLEADFVSGLDRRCQTSEGGPIEPRAGSPRRPGSGTTPSDEAVATMRALASSELVPPVYEWLAEQATWPELVRFLAIEGGPDAGFDDLVAQAQIGIHDGPKVALAANYWDELGRGALDEVHTVLHDRLVAAIDMPRIPRTALPTSALERTAIGGLLATNRRLQPEMIGALGLLELQAGPRCRAVVRALTRLDAPEGAFPFYEEHARADPRHGKEWLDQVVAPLAGQHPGWGARMVRGARWRHEVNHRFFADVAQRLLAS